MIALVILCGPLVVAGLLYAWHRWSCARAQKEYERWRVERDLEILERS